LVCHSSKNGVSQPETGTPHAIMNPQALQTEDWRTKWAMGGQCATLRCLCTFRHLEGSFREFAFADLLVYGAGASHDAAYTPIGVSTVEVRASRAVKYEGLGWSSRKPNSASSGPATRV